MIPIDEIKTFGHEQFGSIQIFQQDYKIYIGATQVALALGYPKPIEAISTYCRAESVRIFEVINAPGMIQKMGFITEGDVYRLILNSNNPLVAQYETWLAEEVLPALRLDSSQIKKPKQRYSPMGVSLPSKNILKKNLRSAKKETDSLDALFDTYYQAQLSIGRAEKTLKSYKHNYSIFCEYLDGRGIPREYSSITTEVGRDYVIWLRNEKRKFSRVSNMPEEAKTVGLLPLSVNTRLSMIKAMFRFLHEDGEIADNPFSRVRRVTGTGRDISVLSADELVRLLKAPDQHRYCGFRDFVVLNVLIDGMFRIDEALTLMKSDIDMQSGVVTLRKEIVKTRKSRMVPLTKQTIKLIRELNAETEDFGSEFIFLTNQGARLTPHRFGKRLKDLSELAGISKRTYAHLMRHSGATLFLEAGGSARHLQMILGHSDARMTNHYTHLSDASIKRNHDDYSAMNVVTNRRSSTRKILR